MQKYTDSQKKRRKDAIFGALFYSASAVISAGLMLYVRSIAQLGGFWDIFLLLTALADLGIVIPICISLKERLKEIQGGEEDAAAQY